MVSACLVCSELELAVCIFVGTWWCPVLCDTVVAGVFVWDLGSQLAYRFGGQKSIPDKYGTCLTVYYTKVKGNWLGRLGHDRLALW